LKYQEHFIRLNRTITETKGPGSVVIHGSPIELGKTVNHLSERVVQYILLNSGAVSHGGATLIYNSKSPVYLEFRHTDRFDFGEEMSMY